MLILFRIIFHPILIRKKTKELKFKRIILKQPCLLPDGKGDHSEQKMSQVKTKIIKVNHIFKMWIYFFKFYEK